MILRPVRTEFHGLRTGLVSEPFGYSWFAASRIEEVSPEEMQSRWAAMMVTPE